MRGIDSPHVATAIELLNRGVSAGGNAVVVGGGMMGCELAVYLAQKGKKVTIIEMLPLVLNDMNNVHANRQLLMKMLQENDVAVLTSTALDEVI